MFVTIRTFLLSTPCLLFTCPFAYSNEINTGHINSESSSLKLHKLSSTPGGLTPNSMTQVVFAIALLRSNVAIPAKLVISGDVTAALNDRGKNGDFTASDDRFGGTAMVDTTGLTPGDCLTVTVTATQGDTTVVSDDSNLCVSSFPLAMDMAPADMSNIVTNSESGVSAVADEVMIVVAPGTSESVINQIAASAGGVIAGWVPSADIYYIKLQTSVSSGVELTQIITDLKNIPEVLTAEENAITN